MTDEPLVEIRGIVKKFEPNLPSALTGINALIPKGKMVGLAGPDGAGKTTLIRLIAGLLKPSEGSITVDGYDTVKDANKIHELIGYMPQKFGLYEDLTVIENLNLYADLRGVPQNERSEVYAKLLHFTALGPFTDRLAGNLSGGMKQKLGLACALLSKPKLLVLDEPSVGVDPRSRRELWKIVQGLLHEGISILWSTAYLDEAESCDTVLLLSEGKLLFNGPPSDLTKTMEGMTYKIEQIEGSRRQVLAELLKDENVIDGVIQGSAVRIVLKEKGKFPKLRNGQIVETPPRFEDAFVALLGGAPKEESPLVSAVKETTATDQLMIEAHHLSKKFDSFTAVNDVCFEIPRGEIFGLLGPNGAGKSTTFKLLCGLLKPSAGTSSVNGIDLQLAPSEGRAQIGYMAQKFSLYGYLSAKQNLDFFSGVYNLEGSKRKKKIEEMVEIFNLSPYLDENARDLPLGFKQRLALSCAIMHAPQVLFLDEPTSGVDPITRREFWNHINSLVEKGITIMVTTHFMDEAEYCDRIGLVYQGKLIKVGTPDELKSEAKSKTMLQPTLEDAFIHYIDEYDKL